MKNVDGFIWKVIKPTQAKLMFGIYDLFELHDDGSESLIETRGDLDNILNRGGIVGLEVGHLDASKAKD